MIAPPFTRDGVSSEEAEATEMDALPLAFLARARPDGKAGRTREGGLRVAHVVRRDREVLKPSSSALVAGRYSSCC
jgi:hypothetical protein